MPRAVIVNNFGADDLSNIEVVDRPIPRPGNGQVVVRVTCRPVNPADAFSVKGQYPGFNPEQFPAVPGLEGCGVVHDNNGINELSTGQRVIVLFEASTGQGSWQEYVVVPKENLIPIPDNVPDETASQFFVNPVTVLGMLQEVQAPPGSYILQTAAGSTLGRMLITVAKLKGLKTINLVRRDQHITELKDLGADIVLNTEKLSGSLVDVVRAQTGGEYAWAAFDCVAGDFTKEIVSCVKPGGCVLVFAGLASMELTCGVYDLLFRGVTVKGFWLTKFLEQIDDTVRNRMFNEILDLMKEGQLKPRLGESFPLERAREAIQKTMEPGKGGKVLLTSSAR